MSDLLSRCKLFNALAPIQTLGEAYGVIQGLETEDAEYVKHGRWIIRTRHEHYPSGRAYEEIVCPFCRKVDHNGDGNFCGYCGADMRKDDGDE